MSNAPHTPAAFINAIAEEGSKKEAIEWLQKTWNERCHLERENEALRKDAELALAQAREEGRREGMREALRVSEQAVSDLAQIYGLLQEGKVDEAEDYCRCAAEGYTQDIARFSETPGASAITRAAEGK
jgi:flagellar biosynthesis/type III secretory pathway protein FliH